MVNAQTVAFYMKLREWRTTMLPSPNRISSWWHLGGKRLVVIARYPVRPHQWLLVRVYRNLRACKTRIWRDKSEKMKIPPCNSSRQPPWAKASKHPSKIIRALQNSRRDRKINLDKRTINKVPKTRLNRLKEAARSHRLLELKLTLRYWIQERSLAMHISSIRVVWNRKAGSSDRHSSWLVRGVTRRSKGTHQSSNVFSRNLTPCVSCRETHYM